MGICQVCGSEVERLCIVSVFIPGRDEQNVHNTVEIGRICNECTVKLMSGEIKLETPTAALTLNDMLGQI